MDIKQLEFFVTACDHGSLSRAAECMYTSQPNLSKTIRTLEHELGRPLLLRSAKGVQPTAYGKTVLEHARLILKNAAAISSLAVPDEQDSLRISSYPSNMISRLLVDFYLEWGKNYHIEYREGSAEEITDHVHQGISEIGIVYVAQKQVPTFRHILSHKRLEFVSQDVKKICVYAGPKNPLYGREWVDFSDLSQLKFLDGVRDFFSMEHHLNTVSMGVIDTRQLRHAAYTNSDHFIINLLMNTDICSLGLEFMHEPYAKYEIKPLAIQGCEPFLEIGYVRDPERNLSPQACWVTEHFQDML